MIIDRIAASISFDEIVRKQRKLSSELRQLRESVYSAKTEAEKHHALRDSESIARQLDSLKGDFDKAGVSFYGAANVIAEVELRAKLDEENVPKEIIKQTRKDLQSLRSQKTNMEVGLSQKTRSWSVFQLKYWGLTGRAVKWIAGLSGGATFIKGWKDYFNTGVSAQQTQLETVGKLDGGIVDWGAKAASFSVVKSEISGVLKAYNISGANVDELTQRFVALVGPDRLKAESVFSSLASTARIAQIDIKDAFDYAEKRSKRYNQGLEESTSEFSQIISIVDGTSAEVEKQNKDSGVVGSTRNIFRKEYLESILSVTSEIESKSGFANQVTVAKMFSSGVVAANKLRGSVSTTLTTAKAYTKFLHLDDVYNYQLGMSVIARIDSEVEKKSRGQSALQGDRITHEVIFNMAGKELGANMELMYKTAKEGGYFAAASDIGRLWSQTAEGSMETAKINYEAVLHGSSDYGVQLLVSAGLSREEAVTAVVAVKAGRIESLTPVQQALLVGKGYEQVTADNYDSYQKTITEGAKSMFGDVTSIITKIWGSPLAKMAAGLGLMAYTFRKEIKDTLLITREWASLAASYMKLAGIEKISQARNLLSSVTGSGLRKAGIIGGLATVGAVGLAYGVGKSMEMGSGDPKEQAKQMVPSTPLGNELEGYVADKKTRIDPVKVGEIVEKKEGISKGTERVTNNLALDDAISREKAMKRSVVESMGGRIVQRNGREVAEVRFPGFVANATPTG